MNMLQFQELASQLEFHPFLPEACKLKGFANEMHRYKKCMERWTLFFSRLASEKQRRYEQNRLEWLRRRAEEARKRRPRKKKATRGSRLDKELFKKLLDAGVPRDLALEVASK